MPINKSLVPASLASGLDTDTDPKLGPKGLTRVEDGVYKHAGVISKRFGTTEIGAHSEEWLTQYDDIAIAYGNTGQVKVYDGSDFDVIDYIGNATVQIEQIYSRSDTVVSGVEVALQGSIFLSVWNSNASGSGAYAKTWDSNTDRELDYTDLDGYSNSPPRCIATTSGLYIIHVDSTTGGGDLVYREVNTSTGAIGSAVKLKTLNGSIKGVPAAYLADIDICHLGGTAQTIAIACIDQTGYPQLICFKTTTTKSAWVDEPFTTVDAHAVAIYQQTTDTGIMMAYAEESGPLHRIYALGFDEEANVVITQDTVYSTSDTDMVVVNMAGCAIDSVLSKQFWTLEDQGVGSPAWDREVYQNTFEDSGGTGDAGTASSLLMGAQLASKPWYDSPNMHMLLIPHNGHTGVDVSSQWTYVIFEDSDMMYGKFLINRAYYTNFPTNVQTIQEWFLLGALQAEAIYDNQPEYVGQARIWISMIAGNAKTCETEDVLIIPGSMPFEFDGQETYEQPFICYPHKVSPVLNGSGNLDVDKTYSYKAVYEFTDRKGNRYQSAPSPAATIETSTGNTQTIVTVPTLTFTKRADITVVLYRTAGNGVIYYRCATGNSDRSERSVGIADNLADDDLTSQETLYTTGGILDNIQPPPFSVQCLYQNRHFVVDADRPEVLIRYSKPIDKGFGIEHSDYLTVECNAEGGPITALTEFQDRLLIFKENRIYMTYGAGYDNLGTGNNYYDPSLLSNTVGCNNQKAILQTPQGIVFPASDDNFYLINRQLQIAPFGDPVQHWHDHSTVTAGAVMHEQNEVIWMNSDADGYALVFNWHFGMWSTWSQYQGTDIIFYDDTDVLMFKKNDGSIWKQNTASYVDNPDDGYAPELKIETGWYSFSGIAGFTRLKRIMIVAQNISDHELVVKIGYNFDPVWTDTYTYDATTLKEFDASEYYTEGLDASYENQAYVLEVPTSKQKITSVRVHVSESTRTSTGASFEIAGIAFEVGTKVGPYRLGDDKKTE